MAPLNRDDLDHALDRALKPLSEQIVKLTDDMRDAGVDFAAQRADLIELTRRVGVLHDKTTGISNEVLTFKTIMATEGRLVRVRDVGLVGGTISAAWLVLHLLLKLL